MAYGQNNYGNNGYGKKNYGGNNYGNNNYQQPQQQQQPPQPQQTIEEQIAQRLDTFQLILQMAEERGITKDDLLMGAGLTAWVTSMVGNFKR